MPMTVDAAAAETQMTGRLKDRSSNAASVRFLIDNSLSIVNRTGAYQIAKDLCRDLSPEFAKVRYWRLGRHAPEGVLRKVMARLMMQEINWLGDRQAFLLRDKLENGAFRLFLDPLYVLRSRLTDRDIILCHDVGPMTHSALYDARTVENYRLAFEKIRRAKPGVVFVSDWSKACFKSLYGTEFRRLDTISLYVRDEVFNGVQETVPGIEGRFFLTVGAFETRKNQVASINAYREGGFAGQGIKYVLCGSRGRGHEEIIGLARQTSGVIALNYVSDAQLRWLYARAEAFVLPSLLEGFGMPALEAAHVGLLPIVSADSALVEAVKGVCLQVQPEQPAAIAEAMRQALERDASEKAETSLQLHRIAAEATRERFLAQWRELMLSHGDRLSAGTE